MKSIPDAVALLRQGEIVGVPTETVYGLAVDPRLGDAVAKLYELKGRPAELPLTLLVASLAEAERIAEVTDEAARAGRDHWPGPLTMVLKTAHKLPNWIGDPQRGTVGLRVPDHPVALALLEATGPLGVTSANRSGLPPAFDHSEAELIFGAEVSGYLDGAGSRGQASTVIDFSLEPPQVIRDGPVTVTGAVSKGG